MIRISARIREKTLRYRMLLQIHDELAFEASHGELEQVKAFIKGEMEGALSLEVPLEVDVATGKSWGEIHI